MDAELGIATMMVRDSSFLFWILNFNPLDGLSRLSKSSAGFTWCYDFLHTQNTFSGRAEVIFQFPQVQVPCQDKVWAHLACEKSYVLFEIFASVLVRDHFPMSLLNCSRRSYMPTTSPLLSLLMTLPAMCSARSHTSWLSILLHCLITTG